MMIKNSIIRLFIAALLFGSCSSDEGATSETIVTPQPETNVSLTDLHTDKGMYNPGEMITFTLTKTIANANVRYWYLGQVVQEHPLTGTTWTWQAPSTDFQGYLVEVYTTNGDQNIVRATVGVDISSSWTKFPRYGFLSNFEQMTTVKQKEVIDNLNKYHINGIQYYDWHYRHHQPLAGTVNNPSATWTDIINRQNSLATVQNYISLAKEKNMANMFYNLAFGVLNDYDPNQIPDELFIYKDVNHQNKDKHPLGAPFISDIYITNPANTVWQNYLANENDKVYQVLDFDGFHIDQLGSRGNVYGYNGQAVQLDQTYAPFIQAMKNAHPNKKLVMNAVNQFGQNNIASSSVDFLYTEVWSPNEGFKDLFNIIQDNNQLVNGTKNTVFAAYVNYNKAEHQGTFNTPGVLMANAAIFAMGGSHLELGEHMLGKEYFPNSNLQMTLELKTKLVRYYDFLVGYQNLLRDGGSFTNIEVVSADAKMQPVAWPPSIGKVAVLAKQVANKKIVHLLNFNTANSLSWRDANGTQTKPTTIKNALISIKVNQPVNRVWIASPDVNGGAPQELTFTALTNQINVKVPSLDYWSMIVIE